MMLLNLCGCERVEGGATSWGSWSFDQSEAWIHCLAVVGVVAGGNRALIGCWRIAQLCQREGVLNRVIIVLIKLVFYLAQNGWAGFTTPVMMSLVFIIYLLHPSDQVYFPRQMNRLWYPGQTGSCATGQTAILILDIFLILSLQRCL